MNTSELDRRNIAVSVRKSVENLVISSQDAIGQSISQALSFSGVISQSTNIIYEETSRTVSRSPSPALRNTDSGQSEGSNEKCSFQSDAICGDGSSGGSQDIILRNADKLSSPTPTKGGGDCGARSKKKSWYSSLYPTYKSRSDDFKRIFKDVPDDERLIVDYSCALQKDILAHGRLYASQNYLCFYANIFGWETTLMLRWKDVTAITKEKTALVIPNAILISTDSEKNFLASFSSRDKAYLMLFRIWQNALMDQPISTNEIWQWVHSCYGEELGFNSDDEGRELEEEKVAAEELGETSSMEAGGAESREDIRTPRGLDLHGPAVTNGDTDRRGEDTLPTDMSDSSESDHDKPHNVAVSELCTSKHEGREMLRAQFALNIDHLFTLIFTASKTYLEIMAARNASDFVQTGWQDKPDTGKKSREISYRLAISAGTFGPKAVYVTETQVMNACTRPGVLYSIDILTENRDIPYADHFTVDTHYCLQRVNESTTLVEMYTGIIYKKQTMGLIKGILEKSTMSGIEQYVRILDNALTTAAAGESVVRGRHRRRRTHASALEPSIASVVKSPLIRPGVRGSTPQQGGVSYRLLAIVALLFIINLVLLWALYVAEPRGRVDEKALSDRMSSLGELQVRELSRVLEAHASRQKAEQREWGLATRHVLDMVKQVEETIKGLLEDVKSKQDSSQQSSSHGDL